jgi:hypothetical protein
MDFLRRTKLGSPFGRAVPQGLSGQTQKTKAVQQREIREQKIY